MEAGYGRGARGTGRGALVAAGIALGGLLATASPAAALFDVSTNCTTNFVAEYLPNVATSLSVVNPASSPPIAIAVSVVPAAGENPAYCDVTGTLVTGNQSDLGPGYGTAQFELRLPANWNGKLVYWGVGGAAGGAQSDNSGNPVDQQESLAYGFATAVSDAGHENSDLDFYVLSDPIVAVDYFYRATHDMTVSAKTFVHAFYGSAPTKSYFDGCSNGGRMALKEAEQFPDDFDGVIAGSSYMSTVANAGGVKGVKALLQPGAWISPSLVPYIDAAIYSYCDGLDGVVDGLIQNPMKCNATPVLESLACPKNAPNCLTPAQIAALKVYWGPLTDPQNRLVSPALGFSDLSLTPGFSYWDEGYVAPTQADIHSGEPWGPPADYVFSPVPNVPVAWVFVDTMIKFVEGSSSYDTLDFPVSTTASGGVITNSALSLYHSKTGAGDADKPDSLLPFINKGGKLIMYHGFSDPLVSPYPSILFYQRLAGLVGGYTATQKQVRLFMEPGMGHCGYGPGPSLFDTLLHLDNWVENGVAPEAITATNLAETRSMPLCKYPEMAHYNGTGPVDASSSWSCSPTDTSLLEIGPVGVAAGMRLPQ